MILHVLKSKIYSGAENVVCQIIKGVDGDYDCVYMSPHGTIDEKLLAEGISHHAVEKLDIKAILQAVEKYKPTVVHAHDFTASVLCALALKGRCRVVAHLHNNPPWIKSVNPKTLLFLWASRWIEQILVVSDAVEREFIFSKKIKCPLHVVGNPFSVTDVTKRAGEAAASDVLFTGRFTEQKNPQLVIEIAKALKQAGYGHIKIKMAGTGELFDECQALVEKNDVGDIVELLGFVENPYSYMKETKLQIMPSRWEGFGLVALEAMTFKKPVLTSGAGGLSKIVDNNCGAICSTVEDYVKAIIKLVTQQDYYQTLSENAYQKALSYDNIKEYCTMIEKIYG